MKLLVVGGKQTALLTRGYLNDSPVKEAAIYLVDFNKKSIDREFAYSPKDSHLECQAYSTSF